MNQPAMPGMASPAALLAQAIAAYGELYGVDQRDTVTAHIGVEVMRDRFGSLAAVINELTRLAGQAGDTERQDRAA